MVALTLCSANLIGPAASRTADHWDELGLQQLVFGEAELPPSIRRQLIPDVFTTADDQPCLHDVLRQAGEIATPGSLLLVDHGLRPSISMLKTLDALMRLPGRPCLVHGRAWRQPLSADPRLRQQTIDQVIADPEAQLDPPERPSWVLLPSRSLLTAPSELSSALPQAALWLADQARLSGWRVLEATPACPCLRLSNRDTPLTSSPSQRPHAEAVVEPERPGQVRLSLLVAAPEATFDDWQTQLQPTSQLPWELVLRPDADPSQPGSTVAAWASALEVARGNIIWPLAGMIPPLAWLPLLLDFFDQPWLDLALIGHSSAGMILPASAARQGVPGTIVLRQDWLKRSGAFQDGGQAAEALRHLVTQAEQHGACCVELPLTLNV